jgi:hypothetical protein
MCLHFVNTHHQCPRLATNQATSSFLRGGEPQGARQHSRLASAASGDINLERRGRGGCWDALDLPGGGIGLGIGAPPERAAEESGATVVCDLERRGGRGQPRGRGGDVGRLPGSGVVAVEPEREVERGLAACRAERERQARRRGRTAVRGEAHVEEADLEVHARGAEVARGRRRVISLGFRHGIGRDG